MQCQCGHAATERYAEQDNGYRSITWFHCSYCGSHWAHALCVNGICVAVGDEARALYGWGVVESRRTGFPA